MSDREGTDRARLDRADLATLLAERLRAAGVPVGVSAAEDFVAALALVDDRVGSHGVGSHGVGLYWAGRLTLVDDRRHLEVFDRVFAGLFGDPPAAVVHRPTAALGRVPRRDRPPRTTIGADEAAAALPWTTLSGPGDTGTDARPPVPERLASRAVAVDDTPLEDLDASQLRRLDAAVAEAMARWPRRRSRRERPRSGGGRIALRRTIARSRSTGWEMVALERQGPTKVRRRLVVICDVSQSMQPYTASYLHLMRAVTRGTPSETFAFATSLTRLTPVLARASAHEAVAEAGRTVTDRFGGTRIATSLRTLLHSPHGNTLRGAVCVIASDGWDSDPPSELAAQMARLSRRAHRTIWLNPRAGEPGFEPLAAGMAAALPYCDELLPAHTVDGLVDVLDAIARAAGDARR